MTRVDGLIGAYVAPFAASISRRALGSGLSSTYPCGMPTYRLTPSPTGAPTTAPATDGTKPTVDSWEEVPIEAQGGVDRFTYYLFGKKGVPCYGGTTRTGSA